MPWAFHENIVGDLVFLDEIFNEFVDDSGWKRYKIIKYLHVNMYAIFIFKSAIISAVNSHISCFSGGAVCSTNHTTVSLKRTNKKYIS